MMVFAGCTKSASPKHHPVSAPAWVIILRFTGFIDHTSAKLVPWAYWFLWVWGAFSLACSWSLEGRDFIIVF
jgi:hypothetical protein